jgi:hypothetical protein
MTAPNVDDRIPNPVAVEITNWAPPIKPPVIKNTTVKTYIIDPANVNFRYVQITDFEPKRSRLAIQVIDSAVALLTLAPSTSPDTSSATVANDGLYLPPNVAGPVYTFYGPDAFWLNALTTVTRVTVTKEYRE